MLSTLLVVGVISHLWCAARLVGIAHHSFYSVTLTSDLENCNSLSRIAITIETDAVYTNYVIGFSTSTNLGGIYIGESKFSDEAISTRSSM